MPYLVSAIRMMRLVAKVGQWPKRPAKVSQWRKRMPFGIHTHACNAPGVTCHVDGWCM